MVKRVRNKRGTRNKFETRVFDQLVHSKAKFAYECDRIPYVIEGYYLPDFVITTKLGVKIYIETKGYFRPESKRKMVAVKKAFPELDIRIVFYKATKTNTRWAIKHGFKFAFHTIPEDWLDEF